MGEHKDSEVRFQGRTKSCHPLGGCCHLLNVLESELRFPFAPNGEKTPSPHPWVVTGLRQATLCREMCSADIDWEMADQVKGSNSCRAGGHLEHIEEK